MDKNEFAEVFNCMQKYATSSDTGDQSDEQINKIFVVTVTDSRFVITTFDKDKPVREGLMSLFKDKDDGGLVADEVLKALTEVIRKYEIKKRK